MKRQFGLIITLSYVFGTIGIPITTYSCVESGEAGVIAYLAASPRSCYVKACCDDEQDLPNLRIESDVPCCNASVQGAPENNRTLLPNQKNGHAEPLTETSVLFHVSRPNASITPARLVITISCASINLPLLF